jgi:hypothetical protein
MRLDALGNKQPNGNGYRLDDVQRMMRERCRQPGNVKVTVGLRVVILYAGPCLPYPPRAARFIAPANERYLIVTSMAITDVPEVFGPVPVAVMAKLSLPLYLAFAVYW